MTPDFFPVYKVTVDGYIRRANVRISIKYFLSEEDAQSSIQKREKVASERISLTRHYAYKEDNKIHVLNTNVIEGLNTELCNNPKNLRLGFI